MIKTRLMSFVRNLSSPNKKHIINKTEKVGINRNKAVSPMDIHESTEIPKEKKAVSLMFAHRCLFRCKHCYFWKYKNRYDSMELKDWIKCIDYIYEQYGINVQVELGGDGTAEINKALIPLISRATHYGIRTTLPTNGYLINKQLLKRIVHAGINCIAISLDFLSPKLHDKQRGFSGSYRHVLKLLGYLKKLKTEDVDVVLNCIIMDRNLDELTHLVRWAQLLPQVEFISFQSIVQPLGAEFDNDWYLDKKYSYLWPKDTKKVVDVIDELVLLKKKGYKIQNTIGQLHSFKNYFLEPDSAMDETGCNIDLLGMQVFVNGDLQVCSRKGYIGSLKENSMNELLNTKKFYELKEEISNCSLKCHQRQNCRYYD